MCVYIYLRMCKYGDVCVCINMRMCVCIFYLLVEAGDGDGMIPARDASSTAREICDREQASKSVIVQIVRCKHNIVVLTEQQRWCSDPQICTAVHAVASFGERGGFFSNFQLKGKFFFFGREIDT